MKIRAKAFPFTMTFAAQTSARSFLRFTSIRTKLAPMSLARRSEAFVSQPTSFGAAGSEREPSSIYAVDDAPLLTELYTTFLEGAGYVVKTFNHRVKALAALKTDRSKPSLLITNYLGGFMPVNYFIQACRSVQPNLRILMASGYEQSEMQFARTRPDWFIQKPFTPEELQDGVKAALGAQ